LYAVGVNGSYYQTYQLRRKKMELTLEDMKDVDPKSFDVDITENYVAFHDNCGEMLYYSAGEWDREHNGDEAHNVVLAIATAMKIGYTQGPAALRVYLQAAPLDPLEAEDMWHDYDFFDQ
jgi:hypothetical protein